jgi:hypothetical protein
MLDFIISKMKELDRAIEDLGGEIFIMYSGERDPEKYINEWGYAGMETPHQSYSSGFQCKGVQLRIDLGGKSHMIELPPQLERDLMDAVESILDEE